jgi:trehalose 6-phosphate synthase
MSENGNKAQSPSKPTSVDPLIVIASNRGPYSFSRDDNGDYKARRGEGGLVTALSALAQQQKVLWVAAALSDDDRAWAKEHPTVQDVDDILLKLIITDKDEYDAYYNTIANPLLWFIQHELWDMPRQPTITEATWKAWDSYVSINRQFAEVIADSIKDETRPIIVLPQDYHLYLVAHFLRQRVGDRVQIQPFVHIPWPGPDAWRLLPERMRTPLLQSLMAANRIGFQTTRDAFNFVQTCRFHIDDAHSYGSRDSINYKGHKVGAKTYPISIDVDKVQSIASETETQLLKTSLLQHIGGRRLILRVDRVEPSKNILRGLEAYRTLIERYPEHRGKVTMMCLLVPSRMEVDHYQNYLREIMASSGMINAEYADEIWEPVRIIVGGNYHRAIAAMQLYDVLLVNPIADGMNLVAKEGVLVNERDGVLLLSEYAGAYYEMGDHALSITPVDVFGTAEAMHQGLTMSGDERVRRSNALRELVSESGVRTWFYNQVEDATEALRTAEADS